MHKFVVFMFTLSRVETGVVLSLHARIFHVDMKYLILQKVQLAVRYRCRKDTVQYARNHCRVHRSRDNPSGKRQWSGQPDGVGHKLSIIMFGVLYGVMIKRN